jgi:release factor glutamine methyltransferase
MKIHEAIACAAQRLEEAAVPNSRLDAERLLAFELGTNRAYLLAHFQDSLDKTRLEHFLSRVQVRAQGKPLQYLLGNQEFCSLQFEVTPDVLIPRPETELLVEEAVQRFREGESRMVDVGTGSGCIAVSVAVVLPRARLWATDLSAAALEVAGRNAARHKVSERIQFVQGDLLLPLQGSEFEGTIDCILSNPPYVPDKDLPKLQREVRDWEPRIALVAGPSGLGVYKRLIPDAHRCLKAGGQIIMEIGYNMRDQIVVLFDRLWVLEAVREDYNGIPRVVVASKK